MDSIKLYVKKVKYENEKGETKHYSNYYLLLNDTQFVPIKPSFNNDKSVYKLLDCFAEKMGD